RMAYYSRPGLGKEPTGCHNLQKRFFRQSANILRDEYMRRFLSRPSVWLLPVVALGLCLRGAPAQPTAPAPPARYDVHLRYRINAPGNQRIAQFLAMTRYLEALGFNKNPGEETEAEDPTETRMSGTIKSANAR